MKSSLRPLSFLYECITDLRNSIFKQGLIETYKMNVPVISIGNLTVGGTGKTPVTDFCLKKLVKDSKKVAVVSRSYKGQVSQPCRIDINHPFGARYYGDEPFLLAQSNPGVAVFVGSSKWKVAQYIESTQEVFDVVIIDDGYQHQKLHRDLNVLILDATEEIKNYKLVPEGRARESWVGISRADVIVLTKCNLVVEDQIQSLKKLIPQNKETLNFGYDIQTFVSINSEVKTREEVLGKKFFLVSAIGRPDVFEKMMGKIGVVSKESLHFRDHHQYSDEDLQQILNKFNKSECDYLITTQKDAVKLIPMVKKMNSAPLIWSAHLDVNELEKRGRLDELIHHYLR